jgi:hypothetical protein
MGWTQIRLVTGMTEKNPPKKPAKKKKHPQVVFLNKKRSLYIAKRFAVFSLKR